VSLRGRTPLNQNIIRLRSKSAGEKERKTVMNEYEVAEVFEIGDAGEVIQTPKYGILDEVAGTDGPNQYSQEDE